MRKKRDGESTKKTVIEAAEKFFAKKGYNGTSIQQISADCGISEGLILYHFKSKSGLYDEVLSLISKRYAGILESVFKKQLPPREMLGEALDAVFDFWQNDTSYRRINLWSYLEGRKSLAKAEKNLTAGMAQYLETLKKNGVLPVHTDPVVLLSMIIGPIQYWARYKQQFAETLNLDGSLHDLDRNFLESFKRQLMSLMR